MKKMTTKLMLAGVLLSTVVNAQQTIVPALENNYVISGYDYSTHAKSTAIQSRLVASSFWDFANGVSYTLKDSTTLTYSGDRGHDSAMTVIKFDESVVKSVILNVLSDISRTEQTFDADNNISTSILQFWNTGTNTWGNAKHTAYTYDSDNRMLTSIVQNWNAGTNSWENNIKENYTYDVNGNVVMRVTQQWSNVFLTWTNSGRYIYEFNGNNDEVMYVFQYWDLGTSAWVNLNKTTSVYTGTDLTDRLYQNWSTGTSSWINSERNIYAIDAYHHRLSDTRQYYSMGNWVNVTKHIYTYAGNDVATDIMQNWNMGTSSWDNSSKALFTYDADHMIIMVVNQDYNNGTSDFENDTRRLYTYNSFNQTTSTWDEVWNASIWQVTTTNTKENYYYEEYGNTDPSSVAGVGTASDFNLYPVPAQNFVTIEKTWNTPTAFTVSVTDLQGRLIRSYSEKATANYSRNIDVNELSSGNYVIKITTANGKASYQQFSVMH